MADLNTYSCTCRLVADPQVRFTPSGVAMATMRLAVQGRPRGKGQSPEVLFIEATAWGKLAETCYGYLRKGHRAGFTGRLRLAQWNTAAGERRERVELVVEQLAFLQPKVRPPEPGDSGEGEAPAGDEVPF